MFALNVGAVYKINRIDPIIKICIIFNTDHAL